jgi:redox-sensitive bicupin YhaK (pirin superfamily)
MFWSHKIPRQLTRDDRGKATELTLIAGRFAGLTPLAPPPKSWAARVDSDVAIWTLKLEPGARFTLPAATPTSKRMLYFFRGEALTLGGSQVMVGKAVELAAGLPAAIENGARETELLLLQGRPIGEPVVQRGPFVMTTGEEIQRAFADYRRTQFGGWPWDRDDPVHGPDGERFARRPNGDIERAS